MKLHPHQRRALEFMLCHKQGMVMEGGGAHLPNLESRLCLDLETHYDDLAKLEAIRRVSQYRARYPAITRFWVRSSGSKDDNGTTWAATPQPTLWSRVGARLRAWLGR